MRKKQAYAHCGEFGIPLQSVDPGKMITGAFHTSASINTTPHTSV